MPLQSDSTGIYDSRIVSTVFNIAFERMLQDIFEKNKQNIENALENLIIPTANEYLNGLTLQDLINLITGQSGSSGPVLDGETGQLICDANEEPTTSELLPTVDQETSQSVDPTLTEPTNDDDRIESTTRLDPDDKSNSSNFLFNKFQVAILTLTTIVCLGIC